MASPPCPGNSVIPICVQPPTGGFPGLVLSPFPTTTVCIGPGGKGGWSQCITLPDFTRLLTWIVMVIFDVLTWMVNVILYILNWGIYLAIAGIVWLISMVVNGLLALIGLYFTWATAIATPFGPFAPIVAVLFLAVFVIVTVSLGLFVLGVVGKELGRVTQEVEGPTEGGGGGEDPSGVEEADVAEVAVV